VAEPCRIILVHDHTDALPEWVARLVDRLIDDPGFDVMGTVPGVADTQDKDGLSALLWAEEALIRRRLPRYDTQRATSFLASLPEVDMRIGHCGADLALALCGRHIADEDLDRAGLTEWSLHTAGRTPALAVAGARAALAEQAPLVPLTLMGRTAVATMPLALCSAHYSIKHSAALLAAFLKEKAVPFLLRMLRCHAQGLALSTGADTGEEPSFDAGQRIGGRQSYPAGLMRAVKDRVSEKIGDRVGRPVGFWELRVGEGEPDRFEPAAARHLPRLSHAMADPFLLQHEGDLFVFFEAYGRFGGNGWIDVARLNGDRLDLLGTALRCDYHLSFPHVFSHAGDIFMMPETQQKNRLEIWKAVEFPLSWTLHATALEGRYPADSSILHHDGKWWLFTNLSDHHAIQEHSSELYLYQIDGPDLKILEPHPVNPVVVGSNVARNAGAVMMHNGQLYRPSQNNCRGIYGYGLNIMRIDRLDMQEYHETRMRAFTPPEVPQSSGLHHVSFAGGRFVIDVFRR